MPERDYTQQPVTDALGLRSVIDGLAHDLQDLRAGRITVADANARAALAKQVFNGVRLFIAGINLAKRPDAAPPAIPNGRTQEAPDA